MRQFYFVCFVLFFLFSFIPCAFSQNRITEKEAKVESYLRSARLSMVEDADYAQKLAKQALALSEEIDYKQGQIGAYLVLAEHCTYAEPHEAYQYFQKAQEKAQKTANYALLVEILEQKSHYHIRWLQYDEARKCIQESIKLIETHDLATEISYETMAIISAKEGNYRQAIDYYKKVIAYKRTQEPKYSAGVFSEMGNVYYQLGNYDSAKGCYLEGLALAQKNNQQQDFGYLYDNVGLVFYKQKNYHEALVWQKKAFEHRKKGGTGLNKVVSLNNLGKTYLALNLPDSAFLMAQESYPLAMEFKDLFFLQEVNEVLAAAYFGLKKYDSAFIYQQYAYQYLDSSKQKQEKQAIKGAASVMEAQKQVLTNQMLVQENHILSMIGILSTSLFLTILLASLFIFRQNQIRKKLLLQLQKANHTKDHLFAIVAHDLKSPVASFQLISKQLNRFIKRNQIDRIEVLGLAIDKSTHSLGHLLDNLLNWALFQKQEIVAKKQNIALETIFNSVQSHYEEIAKSLNIEFLVESPAEIYLDTDPNLLQTILRNLLNNALKYTPEGGQISLLAQQNDQEIQIWVKDTGTGMSEEQVQTILGEQIKISEKGIRGEHGTGLGLGLVYQFSQILQIHIQVESEKGKGTIFCLSLPR